MMIKKTTYWLLSGFLLATVCIKAQSVGLQFSPLIPIGKTAYSLKTGYGGEINFMGGDIDDRWKFNFFFGFHKFAPTQDTFKTYGIEESNNGTQMLPGYEVIHKYNVGSAGFGCLFKMLDKKFSPIVGVDGSAAIIVISEDDYTETLISSSSTNDTYWQFAICPKLGASYQIKDNWLINGGLGFNLGFGSTGLQSYWKPFIMLNYYFD